MNENEDATAQALDAFLTARLAGEVQPAPESLPAGEAALAFELMALAQETHPAPGFANNLETQLRQRVAAQSRRSRMAAESRSVTPQGTGRRLAVHRLPMWAAAVLLLLAGSLFVPEVRARVVEVFRLGAVRILLTDEMPAEDMPPLDGETTLPSAQGQVDFPIRLPTYPPDLGLPDRVLVQEFRDPLIVLLWLNPGQPGHVRYALYQLANTGLIEKLTGRIQETQVNGRRALWTQDPHMLRLPTDEGAVTRNVESNVLVWTEGGVTYRLETDGTLEEAIQIAQSLR